jgi:hypothetical protein
MRSWRWSALAVPLALLGLLGEELCTPVVATSQAGICVTVPDDGDDQDSLLGAVVGVPDASGSAPPTPPSPRRPQVRGNVIGTPRDAGVALATPRRLVAGATSALAGGHEQTSSPGVMVTPLRC